MEGDEHAQRPDTKALNAQLRELQQQVKSLQGRLARTNAPTSPTPRPPAPIDDPAARFRAEVTAQWQQRVAAGYPLDPGFLADLKQLTPSQYRKAASVAMEILTGRVQDNPGRNVHRLRTGTAGNNPNQRTSTGHYIMRANRQTNAPAAPTHPLDQHTQRPNRPARHQLPRQTDRCLDPTPKTNRQGDTPATPQPFGAGTEYYHDQR